MAVNQTVVVAALVRERAGYLARGLDGKAGLVAARLAELGVEIEPSPPLPVEVAVDSDPQVETATTVRRRGRPPRSV